MKFSKLTPIETAIILFMSIALLTLIIPAAYSYLTVNEVAILVKDKEITVDNGKSKYLIFTENEVFSNKDRLVQLKFNSSDVFNSLDVGERYTVKVDGLRIPIISEYRNILKVMGEVESE